MKKISLKNKKLIWSILVVGLFASLLIIISDSKPPFTSSEPQLAEEMEFQMTVDYGDGRVGEYPLITYIEGADLFSITRGIMTGSGIDFEFEDYGEMGMLVTGIGDKVNGDGGYWQYWVNGEYAEVGAKDYRLQDGDVVEWKFTDAQQ